MMKLERKKKTGMGLGNIIPQATILAMANHIDILVSIGTLLDHQVTEGMNLTIDAQDPGLEIDHEDMVLVPLTDIPHRDTDLQGMDLSVHGHVLVTDHEVGHHPAKALTGQWLLKKSWLVV